MQVIEIAIYGIALSQLNVINFIYFIFFNLFINSIFFNKTLPNVPQIITNCQKHSKLINTCVNKYKKLNDVLQISIILFKLLFIYIFRYLFNYNGYGIRIITNNFVNKLKIYHDINNNNSMSNIFLTDITNKNLTDESTETSDDSEQYNITEYDNDTTDGEETNENQVNEGYYEDSDTEVEEEPEKVDEAEDAEDAEDAEEAEEEDAEEAEDAEDAEDAEENTAEYPIISNNDNTPITPIMIETSETKTQPYTLYNYIFSFFKYV
jgi:hypothetical protein